ncbi:oligosaccharide flippase family protein [Streptococcus parasuis]|uniref:oligosaccharide flippase family protein n=1 Tax=Streptococcus parasuis TaxID=1501662 RepID=UPI001C1F8AC3|nr:oligosaccharide flippase family protein [Streptococcus parasuis]QWV86334.1 oligosaccharide flippase family protein [Streptococcus parasuis]
MANKYKKDIIVQGIARVMGGGLSFLAVFVLTYIFDESQIGEYNLILVTINVITSIFTLWLSQGILRYYDGKKDIGFAISNMLISGVFSIIMFLFINIVSKQNVSIHAYIYMLVLVFYNIFDAIFRKERHLISYVVLELLLATSRIFPMVVIALITKDYNAVFISQYILMFAYIFIYLLFSKSIKNISFSVDKKLLFKYLKFGLPLLGLSVSNWLLTSSDRYMIKYFKDDFSVGIYSTNYSLGNSIYMMFALIMINAFHPIIVKAWDKDKVEGRNLISKVLDYYILLVAPLVFYGCLKSKILLGLLKNDTYSEYNDVFIWTVLGIFVYGLSLLYHKYYELTENTGKILMFNLLVAVFNISLNIILIPRMGFSIAAFTTFLAYLMYFALVRASTYKVFNVSFSLNKAIKILVSVILFWILDYKVSPSDNIMTFFIEGFIYVIYTMITYQVFRIIDIRSLVIKSL